MECARWEVEDPFWMKGKRVAPNSYGGAGYPSYGGAGYHLVQ